MKKTDAKGHSKRKTKPQTIDAYLAMVSPEARATLSKLRKTIRSAAPKATEQISYGMPMFRHHRMLVAFAAFTHHCSLFPMSRKVMARFQKELQSYETSAGTIRFPTNKGLPATLVRKIVKARIDEIEERLKAKKMR